jgi:putative ABC transport system permease protein
MRQAIRSLLKAREFTFVAIAIIAIGIGADTAVFSIVDAALLRPLPFKDSPRLFMLAGVNPKRGVDGAPFSYPAYVELAARDRTRSGLDEIAAVTNDRFNATDGEHPEQLSGARVSASFFDVLGVDTAAGRTFNAPEDTPGGPAVAVLGRRYWARRFSGSPGAVGATMTLNGAPYTVVGALGIDLPPPFDDVDVWSTRVEEISGFTRPQIDAGLGYLTAVARLRPGVRVERAQAEVDTIAHAYARANPTNTDADPTL